MPEIEGIQFETLEGNINNPWMLLMHPLMGSSHSWKNLGYVRRLEENYNLVLIDALGHGQSQASEDWKEYTAQKSAKRYLQVLDHLKLHLVDAIGYSLGGWNLYNMMILEPHRFRKVAIGGAHPLKRDVNDLNARIELFQQPIHAILDHFQANTEFRRQQIQKNHFPALVATLKGMRESPGYTDELQRISAELLIYAGTDDYLYEKIKESLQYLSDYEFFTLVGFAHNDPMLKVNRTLPTILDFMQSNHN